MKQFNDITIIGIDQGYGNMKTANTIFPTAIIAYDTAPMFKGDVLEYGGKFYRVGEGHKGFVADKSTDGDFYLLTLAAIAKELEQYRLFTASLCLSVGLPLSWVGSQRESFRQYLMQNETIRFRFNGNLFQLRIVGCKVYFQCLYRAPRYVHKKKTLCGLHDRAVLMPQPSNRIANPFH